MKYILMLVLGSFYFLYSAPSLEKCKKDSKECLVGVSYYTDNYHPRQAQKFKAIIDEKYSYLSNQIDSAEEAVFEYHLNSYLEKNKLPKIFTQPSLTTKLERNKDVVITLASKPRIIQVIGREGFLAEYPSILCDSISSQNFCQLIFIEKKGFSEYADGDFLPSQYYIYDGLYTYLTTSGSSKTIPKYREVEEQINQLREKARTKTEEYFQKYK